MNRGIPREGPSSVYDAVKPAKSEEEIVSVDSLRHLEADSSLVGKIKIARGAGRALLEEAKITVSTSAVRDRALYALALGVCTVINFFDADKSVNDTR